MRDPGLILLLFGVTALAGCPGHGPSTVMDFLASRAIARCQFDARCGRIAAALEKQCETDSVAAITEYPSVYDVMAAVGAGRVLFDGGAAKACLDVYKSASCIDGQTSTAVCDTVFVGLVSKGGACLANSECAGGYCDQKLAVYLLGCPGTCAPDIAVGAACDDARSHCGPSAACSWTTALCTPLAKAGGACGTGIWCQAGLYCQGHVVPSMNTPEKLGVCSPGGNLGDPCMSPALENGCVAGLYCNGVCAARLARGAPCWSTESCQDGLDCIGASWPMFGKPTQGACAPFLDIGASCDPPAGSRCTADATCDAKKICIPWPSLIGLDCSYSRGTQGGCANHLYCAPVTEQCTKSLPLGAACVPPVKIGDVAGQDPCRDGFCGASKVCTLVCKWPI